MRGNAPTMDSVAIQRYLIRGANRPANFEFPNRSWGYYANIVLNICHRTIYKINTIKREI